MRLRFLFRGDISLEEREQTLGVPQDIRHVRDLASFLASRPNVAAACPEGIVLERNHQALDLEAVVATTFRDGACVEVRRAGDSEASSDPSAAAASPVNGDKDNTDYVRSLPVRRAVRKRKIEMDTFFVDESGESDEDDEEETEIRRRKRTRTKARTRSRNKTTSKISKQPKSQTKTSSSPKKVKKRIGTTWDAQIVASLAQTYPDEAVRSGNIEYINDQHPLDIVASLEHAGWIWGLAFNKDGTLLASASTMGTIRVWCVDGWSIVQELRDSEEPHIEEFYCLSFDPSGHLLVAAGKHKDRRIWDDADEDNKVLPSPLKVFDVATRELVGRLDGHEEEVLFLQTLRFRRDHFIISCGQDGRIYKWRMDGSYRRLLERSVMQDDTSNIVTCISFLPNTGNKYFLASGDTTLKLYDFETEEVLQSFEDCCSFLMDCVSFVVDPKQISPEEGVFYVLARGVEMLENENKEGEESSKPITESSDAEARLRPVRSNRMLLLQLRVPEETHGNFTLNLVREFVHPDYSANVWPAKMDTNGRYVTAPTATGRVYVWNLHTGELTAVLCDHDAQSTVRSVLFHTTKEFFVSAAEDSLVKVYKTRVV